jgi:uncharacterized protein YdaU (DUF1376 family)
VSDFYKMDPGDWDFGTASLTLEEEAAYLRIVNAIHKHKGPVPDVDRVLAGMFRTSTRKARALVAALVAAEKLVIEGGKIWNERARSDLVQRGFVSISRAESGAKGGRTRAENAAKALENNDTGQANASSREEKRREEKKEIGKPISKAPDGFEAFWAEVPRKVAKDNARKAYDKALRKADARTLIEAMRRYAQSRIGEDPRYTAHPASWLNAGRWQDEPEPKGGKPDGNSKNERFLRSFLAGAEEAPGMGVGPDRDPPLPLLARG